MQLAVASCKGGTGKTSLACALAQALGPRAALLDCDVEEPNCAIFLEPVIESETDFSVPVPVIDAAKCKGRGRCQQVCEYNAIKLFNGKPFLFEHLCHSCGGCVLACPEKAITEAPHPAGKIRRGRAGGLFFADGIMNIGEPSPVRLIKAVKVLAPASGAKFLLLDGSPGVGCPVLASLGGVDAVVIVAFYADQRPLSEAFFVSPGLILKTLGQVPEDHKHCPILAAVAFYRALGNHLCKP